jgi:hypothetical protein
VILKSKCRIPEPIAIIKIKQAVLQSSIMALYFILLGLGLALYMFEYSLRMTLLDGLLTYGITGLWIALIGFI